MAKMSCYTFYSLSLHIVLHYCTCLHIDVHLFAYKLKDQSTYSWIYYQSLLLWHQWFDPRTWILYQNLKIFGMSMNNYENKMWPITMRFWSPWTCFVSGKRNHVHLTPWKKTSDGIKTLAKGSSYSSHLVS